MSGQSLPQQESGLRPVVVEQEDNGELKATSTPAQESKQPVSGYPVSPFVEGQHAVQTVHKEQKEPLPCVCGVMWTIFIVGWFLGAFILWWIGVFVGCAISLKDERETPGFKANLIFAILGTVIFFVFIFSVT